MKKKWRYKRTTGEEVILADVFSKMVRWIDVFKQVGDIAVQYDPYARIFKFLSHDRSIED